MDVSTHSACKNALELEFNIRFDGDVFFYAAAQAGLGLRRICTKLKISKFSGHLLLRLVASPAPKVLLMLSELPHFSFSIDYGEQSLGRISNLLALILASVLRNHVVYPNYQPIVFRPEAQHANELVYVPIWKSSRRFLKLKLAAIILSAGLVAGLGRNTLSLVIALGKSQVRRDNIAPSATLSLPLSEQFAVPEAGNLELKVTLTQRQRRYSKRVLVFQVNLPLASIPTDIAASLTIHSETDHGSRVNLDVYYCTDPLVVSGDGSTWTLASHLAEHASSGEQYLDGINWSNVKLAWSRFRSALLAEPASGELEMESKSIKSYRAQLDYLISSLDERGVAPERELDASCAENVLLLRRSIEKFATDLEALQNSKPHGAISATIKHKVRQSVNTHVKDIIDQYRQLSPSGSPHALSDIESDILWLGHSLERFGSASNNTGSSFASTTAAENKRAPFSSPASSSSSDNVPMCSLDQGQSLRMVPAAKDLENLEEIEIDFHGSAGHWRLSCDASRLCFSKMPRGAVSLGPLQAAVTYEGGSASFLLSDDLLILQRQAYRPLYMARAETLKLLAMSVEGADSLRAELCFEAQPAVAFSVTRKEACTLLMHMCAGQFGREGDFSCPLDRLKTVYIWRIAELVLLYVSFECAEDGSGGESGRLRDFVYPCSVKQLPQIEMLVARIQRHATNLTTAVDQTIIVRFGVASSTAISETSAAESWNTDILEEFRLPIPSKEVTSFKCYLKKSIPIPGRIFLASMGLFFRCKILHKRIFIGLGDIEFVEIVEWWHSRGLHIVASGSAAFDFVHFQDTELALVLTWLAKHGIVGSSVRPDR